MALFPHLSPFETSFSFSMGNNHSPPLGLFSARRRSCAFLLPLESFEIPPVPVFARRGSPQWSIGFSIIKSNPLFFLWAFFEIRTAKGHEKILPLVRISRTLASPVFFFRTALFGSVKPRLVPALDRLRSRFFLFPFPCRSD